MANEFLEAKLAHLARPDAYPERTVSVERIETHMSYVFLTDRYVYKMKKPVRDAYLDFSTLNARRANCVEEVRLNRRLAPEVYLGVVPLASANGELSLGGGGEVVEWLVRMRRLPRGLMLDEAIRQGRLDDAQIEAFAAVLAQFYLDSEPVIVGPDEYRARQQGSLAVNAQALAAPHYGLDSALLEAVVAAQRTFLDRQSSLLDDRVRQRRLVEGHGDLRPEHVCLTRPPVFIDCLEFDRELRILDPVEELAYLAMECAFVGAPRVGDVVFRTYRAVTRDNPPATLVRFHWVGRALLRARLAARHLEDSLSEAARTKWLTIAHGYVALAHAVVAGDQAAGFGTAG